jgi:hypothetical protein
VDGSRAYPSYLAGLLLRPCGVDTESTGWRALRWRYPLVAFLYILKVRHSDAFRFGVSEDPSELSRVEYDFASGIALREDYLDSAWVADVGDVVGALRNWLGFHDISQDFFEDAVALASCYGSIVPYLSMGPISDPRSRFDIIEDFDKPPPLPPTPPQEQLPAPKPSIRKPRPRSTTTTLFPTRPAS